MGMVDQARAGVQAARPRRAAATVLSICRVMVRQAARTGAGAAIGWSCAVSGCSTWSWTGVEEGEEQPVAGQGVGCVRGSAG